MSNVILFFLTSGIVYVLLTKAYSAWNAADGQPQQPQEAEQKQPQEAEPRQPQEREEVFVQLVACGLIDFHIPIGQSQLVLKPSERELLVLPRTELLEPRAVRIRQNRSSGPSFRIARGFYYRTSASHSQSQSFEKIQEVDQGTLVITTERVAFIGLLKTITVELNKIVAVDVYNDAIGLHLAGKVNTECFRPANGTALHFTRDGRQYIVPATGPILKAAIDAARETDAPTGGKVPQSHPTWKASVRHLTPYNPASAPDPTADSLSHPGAPQSRGV